MPVDAVKGVVEDPRVAGRGQRLAESLKAETWPKSGVTVRKPPGASSPVTGFPNTYGKTSLKDCILLWFHHQIVIHRWGWTLVLNPDGTTTAWNPDKTKVLRSHSPPVRPG